MPKAVADAVSRCLLETNANLGGFFATTLAAQAVVDEAHQAMADFLGAQDPQEMIIGANMTTLTYQMSRTLGRAIAARRRDHRHPHGPRGQRLALAAAGRGSRARVRLLPFDDGSWQVEEATSRSCSGKRTRLVALNYASNLTGSINPVKRLVTLAKEAGALTYVDAVQFAPHGLDRRRGDRLRLPGLLVLQILRAAYGHVVGPARRCSTR